LKKQHKRVAVSPEIYSILEKKTKECNLVYVSRTIEVLALNFTEFIDNDGKIKTNIFENENFRIPEPLLEAIIKKIKEGLINT